MISVLKFSFYANLQVIRWSVQNINSKVHRIFADTNQQKMQGTIELCRKISQWREKAKRRSKEIGALKKRNKEILESRDMWKQKYKEERLLNRALRKEVLKTHKGIKKEENESVKPKHHSSSVQIIMNWSSSKNLDS